MTKPLVCSKNAISSKEKEDDALVLTVTRPVLDSFVEALDNLNSRMRKESQYINGHEPSNVAEFVKRLQ